MYTSNYCCGGENQYGDPIKGYSNSYDVKQLNIYNNKIFNDNDYMHIYEDIYNEYHKRNNEAYKQLRDIYDKVNQQIKDIFGIKTFAEKRAERYKKRIL